jgi:type IV fimbrial biogenesis protein FimT
MSGIPSKQRDSGYTLVEVLVAMTVVSILAAIAIPSFKYVTTSNRITTQVNRLLGDMQFARAEAIKEGQYVTVCVSSNGTSCTGTTNWHNGWIVFMDTNGDGARTGGETASPVLRTQTPFNNTDTFVADLGVTRVIFNRLGYGNTNAANTATVTLHDSTSKAVWTRCLAITPVGQTTTQKAVPAVPGQNCT